jgi:hypothetical protein
MGSATESPNPNSEIPQDDPLRPVRVMVDEILRGLQAQYSKLSPKPIAPEQSWRALLLQVPYSVHRRNVNGTARLQPAVPLVRGREYG